MMSKIKLLRYLRDDPYFGFTTTECILLRWSMNGILFNPNVSPINFAESLALRVQDAGESFMATRKQFGIDPAEPDAPADHEFEYADLVEKLVELPEDKAKHLYYYMVGYMAAWEGDED